MAITMQHIHGLLWSADPRYSVGTSHQGHGGSKGYQGNLPPSARRKVLRNTSGANLAFHPCDVSRHALPCEQRMDALIHGRNAEAGLDQHSGLRAYSMAESARDGINP
jgi:hypothetical protein